MLRSVLSARGRLIVLGVVLVVGAGLALWASQHHPGWYWEMAPNGTVAASLVTTVVFAVATVAFVPRPLLVTGGRGAVQFAGGVGDHDRGHGPWCRGGVRVGAGARSRCGELPPVPWHAGCVGNPVRRARVPRDRGVSVCPCRALCRGELRCGADAGAGQCVSRRNSCGDTSGQCRLCRCGRGRTDRGHVGVVGGIGDRRCRDRRYVPGLEEARACALQDIRPRHRVTARSQPRVTRGIITANTINVWAAHSGSKVRNTSPGCGLGPNEVALCGSRRPATAAFARSFRRGGVNSTAMPPCSRTCRTAAAALDG